MRYPARVTPRPEHVSASIVPAPGKHQASTGLNPQLRRSILRAAQHYGAGHDADDVAQVVLLDCIKLPYLAEPKNVGALMQRVKFRTLHALRAAKRHDGRGEGRFTSWEGMEALTPQ